MKKIDILSLNIDLINTFFCSAHDALKRAQHANNTNFNKRDLELNIFPEKHAEFQAAIETIIASFLAIEATINYAFFYMTDNSSSNSGLDKWLKNKWKRSLSISDKFFLLMESYFYTDLNLFQDIKILFHEFVTFRNRIVHSHPEQYDALIEETDILEEVILHDFEPHHKKKSFTNSKLSEYIEKINYKDAAKCYEIMLLIISLIDCQCMLELKFSNYKNNKNLKHLHKITPLELIYSLDHRYYPKINPKSFKLKVNNF